MVLGEGGAHPGVGPVEGRMTLKRKPIQTSEVALEKRADSADGMGVGAHEWSEDADAC